MRNVWQWFCKPIRRQAIRPLAPTTCTLRSVLPGASLEAPLTIDYLMDWTDLTEDEMELAVLFAEQKTVQKLLTKRQADVTTLMEKTGSSSPDDLIRWIAEHNPRNSKEVQERRRAHTRCSFCGKGQHEVTTLVAGPGVFICDECVRRSVEVVESNTPT